MIPSSNGAIIQGWGVRRRNASNALDRLCWCCARCSDFCMGGKASGEAKLARRRRLHALAFGSHNGDFSRSIMRGIGHSESIAARLIIMALEPCVKFHCLARSGIAGAGSAIETEILIAIAGVGKASFQTISFRDMVFGKAWD